MHLLSSGPLLLLYCWLLSFLWSFPFSFYSELHFQTLHSHNVVFLCFFGQILPFWFNLFLHSGPLKLTYPWLTPFQLPFPMVCLWAAFPWYRITFLLTHVVPPMSPHLLQGSAHLKFLTQHSLGLLLNDVYDLAWAVSWLGKTRVLTKTISNQPVLIQTPFNLSEQPVTE